MKRSLIIFLSTLAFTTSTLAMVPNGFYAGVSAGENQIDVDFNAASDAAYINNSDGINLISNGQTANIKRNSAIGDIYLGYGHQLWDRPFYLAGEMFADVTRRDVTTKNFAEWISSGVFERTNLATSSDIKLNQSEFGLDLVPGFLFGHNYNDMFYGRIGVAFNKINSITNNLLNVTELVPVAPLNLTSALSTLNIGDCKSVLGLRLGVGFEKYFGHNLALHTDYIYTNYGKVTASGLADTSSPFTDASGTNNVVNAGFHSHSSASVTTQTLMLGMNYYFLPSGQQTGYLAPVAVAVAPANFNGFYAGLSLGGMQTAADVTSFDSATYFGPGDEIAILKNSFGQTAIKKNGFTSSEDVGYGFERAPYYLGAEVFANEGCGSCSLAANHTASHSTPAIPGDSAILNSQPNVKLNCFEYGIDALPGVVVAPETLVYGRVGIAFNSLDLAHNNTFTQTNSLFPTPVSVVSTLNTDEKKNVTGLRLGLGVEEYLGDHFAANIDYIYTDYGRINTNGVTGAHSIIAVADGTLNPVIVTVPNGFVSNAKADVSSQAVMIGMKYYFTSMPLRWFAKTNQNIVRTTTTTVVKTTTRI
jgi:opacity protein-like surface antigen